MTTLHYTAATELAALRGLLVLIQLARTATTEFSFGPTDVATAVQQGLTVTGDTDAAKPLLDAVAGLVAEDVAA